jgi:two-component system, NtrC family, response regulator HydG
MSEVSLRTILVVDDDPDMRSLLKEVLTDRGYEAITADGGTRALAVLKETDVAVVLTDLRMTEMDGVDLLVQAKRLYPHLNIILMTAFGSVETAIEAMRHGAYDYLIKPVRSEDLLRVIERAVREAALRRELARLREQVLQEYSFHQIIGKSSAMRDLFDLIRRVADTPTNVLITGESGTGKELVAKALHYNSDRRDAPFVPVNCAAIPDALLESELFGHVRGSFTDAKTDRRGLFEEAQNGTLFLDEISELPLMLQAKLLRTIQEREIRRVGATKSVSINVRIIAATNLALAQEVQTKRFREDLYYRLNVIEMRLPPLRERKDDIPLLIEGFLRRCCAAGKRDVKRLDEAALALLIDYQWPGNVRELENVIERAVTLARGDTILPEDLPSAIRGTVGAAIDTPIPSTLALSEVEKIYIRRILEKTGGNKYHTAHVLGIDRKTLYRKLADMDREREATS